MTYPKIAITAIVLGSLASAANAQTIYNTFGPGNSYDTTNMWVVASYQTVGTSFDVANGGNLYTISLALLTAPYTIYLMNSVGGQPGKVIDSWTFTGTNAFQTLTPNQTDYLSPGTYYVVATAYVVPNPPVPIGGWYFNDIGYTGTGVYCPGGITGPWTISSRITPVLQVQLLPSSPSLATFSPPTDPSTPFDVNLFEANGSFRRLGHTGQ